ncbi:DUF4435 domain-containing protein [Leptospira meyeri]|uniref:DUF4435 domain-containing protein n=1 Tax=Leptospira meyeri TaxID=29508 RepID=UPI000C2AB3D9|nr:DUF4435 domain-containing protein [Leptospira meyeri]PJZ95002.1 hypothetical protein CH358_19395 [Leptospira meyeri]
MSEKTSAGYIVDGDIDLVLNNNLTLKDLFVLDKYCIENYLFDKESVINFIYYSCGTKSKEEIESELNYEQWLNEYTQPFIDLFLHFAIQKYYKSKFTLFNAQKYHKKNKDKYELDTNLIQTEIENIKNEIISEFGLDVYESKYKELSLTWESSHQTLTTIVSGKDYLIPILLKKTISFKKSKALQNLEEVKIILVQFFDTSPLNQLKNKIENL